METQEPNSTGATRKASKGKIIAFGSFLALAVLIPLVIIAVIKKNAAESRFEAYTNGRSLAAALQRHHETFRRLPFNRVDAETGDVLLSWRLQLISFAGADHVAGNTQPTVAWNSPDQSSGIDMRVETLRSPLGANAPDTITHFVCVLDPDSPMSGDKVSLNDIETRDGKSNTGLFMEFPASNIHWAEPRDLTLAEAIDAIRNSPASDGTVVAMADGRAIVVPKDASADDIKKLFLLDNGSPSADWLMSKH